MQTVKDQYTTPQRSPVSEIQPRRNETRLAPASSRPDPILRSILDQAEPLAETWELPTLGEILAQYEVLARASQLARAA
jgi:hypothetical protein